MSGHGHVVPNADGSRARCGGPGACPDCSAELANQYRMPAKVRPAKPPLDSTGIVQSLYDCGIVFGMEACTRGFRVYIECETSRRHWFAFRHTFVEAAEWLHAATVERFPKSDYTRRFGR